MKCFHQSCAPGLQPMMGEFRPEPCVCGDGVVALEAESLSAMTALESIIETSMRMGLLEELEAMGLTLRWDEEAGKWQTRGCDEQPWKTGACELALETRH
jgi:hypothetical protein